VGTQTNGRPESLERASRSSFEKGHARTHLACIQTGEGFVEAVRKRRRERTADFGKAGGGEGGGETRGNGGVEASHEKDRAKKGGFLKRFEKIKAKLCREEKARSINLYMGLQKKLLSEKGMQGQKNRYRQKTLSNRDQV